MIKYDNLRYEKEYLDKGYMYIAGIDEVGRGPLAGPVVCACVVMPLGADDIIEGVNDSKKVSPKRREKLYDIILSKAIDYHISEVSNVVIDEINILNATKLCMKNALEGLNIRPDVVLIDAVKIDTDIEQNGIIKGDEKSYTIACASIVAKVYRDRLMCDMADKYPNYDFASHKGYGTKSHIAKLKQYGECEIHRQSFIKHFKQGS